MHIDVKNIRAKFHPDPIWNNGALDFFLRCRPNKNNKIEYSQFTVVLIKYMFIIQETELVIYRDKFNVSGTTTGFM